MTIPLLMMIWFLLGFIPLVRELRCRNIEGEEFRWYLGGTLLSLLAGPFLGLAMLAIHGDNGP